MELTEEEYYNRKNMLTKLKTCLDQAHPLNRRDTISDRHLANKQDRQVPGTKHTYFLPQITLEVIREIQLSYIYDPTALLHLPDLRPDDDLDRQYALRRQYNVQTHTFEDRPGRPPR